MAQTNAVTLDTGRFKVGPDCPTYFIADIAANHDGDLERAKELIEGGHISRMDYDRLEAEFKNALAALDAFLTEHEITDFDADLAAAVTQATTLRTSLAMLAPGRGFSD